jgi:hypothetical protein
MRRAFSISLILLLWLGPLAAVLPSLSESRLPFCCRRHGAHHCAMDADVASAKSDGGPAFSAPSRCPQFPATVAASPGPAFALTVSTAGVPVLLVSMYSPGASRDAARPGRLGTRADRGPPALAIA